jgi:tetratricopeptide (TPR) repeat protein
MSNSLADIDRSAANLQAAAQLVRAGQWDKAIATAEAAQANGEKPDGDVALLLAVARVRSRKAKVAEAITPELIVHGNPNDVRRLLVSPLAQEGAPEDAVFVLGLLIEAFPPAAQDRRQRAFLNARMGRWAEAVQDVDDIVAADPSDVAAQTSRIRYRMRAGRTAEARDLVRQMEKLPSDQRTLTLMILALAREGDLEEAVELISRIDPDILDDSGLAGVILETLLRAGRSQQVVELGEAFIERAVDGPLVRSKLALAWYEAGDIGKRLPKAIAHLEIGLRQAPDDLRMMSLLGQLLLRSGKTAKAIPYLQKSVELEPDMPQARALYARALKEDGQLEAAAEQFTILVDKAPGAGAWHRYAAGALAQAGKRDEAADLFDSWVQARAAKLPDNFAEGLEALWDKVDEVKIPQPRLDWAWSLRSPDDAMDRAEWDRRAKWGYLADHYLLDWLECRDQQAEEAMHKFAEELDWVEGFIAETRAKAPGKGTVFASAHVGAMYFGPLALELLGVRSRWLASTPSVARTAYAQSLISTSDQTQAQVARGFQLALKDDNAVIVVVDGAINLAAPRIEFAGQDITYSDFASRVAYRMGSSSAFVAPMWLENGHLSFVLEHLPMPDEGESDNDYAIRWRDAYLGHLRKFLAGRPENLRLSGGIWRHIR